MEFSRRSENYAASHSSPLTRLSQNFEESYSHPSSLRLSRPGSAMGGSENVVAASHEANKGAERRQVGHA